jgi:hypothetical protein
MPNDPPVTTADRPFSEAVSYGAEKSTRGPVLGATKGMKLFMIGLPSSSSYSLSVSPPSFFG